jgi:hypothetical protein
MATAPVAPTFGPIIGSPSRLGSMIRRGRLPLLVIVAVATVGSVVGATLLASTPPEPPTALAAPRFVEEAAEAGLEHRYGGEFTFVVGGGVAVLDCDDDGLPDLYLAGGEGPAALYRNVSERGGPLAFEPAGSSGTDLDAVTGAYPLDVDGDGVLDLAVLRVGEDMLLRGTGECGFERANEDWGFDGGDAWSTAFSATWEDGATMPTLAIGHYLGLGADGRSTPDCDDNLFLRPTADGRYDDPTVLSPSFCTLSLLFSDWDRSGRRDLRVSNDRHYYRDGEEQLWRVEPEEDPELWTAADGWQTVRIFGMGIASHDLTGDGRPEVYLTSQADNKLQSLVEGAEGPEYGDIALRRGATAHRPYEGDTTLPSTAWHPEFGDVNNDGFVDLFVTKGNVAAQEDHAMRDPNNLLLGQADGTFVEGAPEAGIVDFTTSRGAAVTDLNLDGLPDVVVVNRGENVSVYRNLGLADGDGDPAKPMGHWAAVRPEQAGGNRDAVGAWIEVRAGGRTWLVERTAGGGHASGQLGWIHIGLGTATDAEVRVTWPDGEVGAWMPVEVDGWAVVDRGATTVRAWMPDEELP